jgi:hypothetical protein
MRRDGFCVPALSSKFVNQVTLTQMYTGKIYNLRQENIVYRECVKPPSKLIMVQKLEKYLAVNNIPSGISITLNNFPDKQWLVLAVASLSKGYDEIFHPDYLPNKTLMKVVEEQLEQPMFTHIPLHLQAKGNGRSLRLTTLTKAQKIEVQLQMTEERILK